MPIRKTRRVRKVNIADVDKFIRGYIQKALKDPDFELIRGGKHTLLRKKSTGKKIIVGGTTTYNEDFSGRKIQNKLAELRNIGLEIKGRTTTRGQEAKIGERKVKEKGWFMTPAKQERYRQGLENLSGSIRHFQRSVSKRKARKTGRHQETFPVTGHSRQAAKKVKPSTTRSVREQLNREVKNKAYHSLRQLSRRMMAKEGMKENVLKEPIARNRKLITILKRQIKEYDINK